MQQHWTRIARLEREGFDIRVEKTWEDTPVEDLFDGSEYDLHEINRKIDRGTYEWFLLRVRACVGGHTLAEEYLGGLLYEDASEVLKDGVAEDLIAECLPRAREEVINLREKLNALIPQ